MIGRTFFPNELDRNSWVSLSYPTPSKRNLILRGSFRYEI